MHPEEAREGRLDRWLELFWSRFVDGLPVILFYVVLFFLVVGIFGLRYAIVVSVFNTFFNIQRKRQYTWGLFLKSVVWGALCVLFACLAGNSLVWCMVLNAVVPFFIVIFRSSQLNPGGYLAYAMMFLYFQLRPPLWEDVGEMLVVVGIGTAVLSGALLIHGLFYRKKTAGAASLHRTLPALADLLDRVAAGPVHPALREEIQRSQQRIIRTSYSYHKSVTYLRDRLKLNDMIATLYQRLGYLAEDSDWRKNARPQQLEALSALSEFLREMDRGVLLEEYDRLIEKGAAMLEGLGLPQGRLRIFCRSFLRMLLLILRTVSDPKEHKRSWRFAHPKLLWLHLRRYYTFRSFEIRFALRLALVLTVTCSISFLLDVPNSFWLPLNAFLMLQPQYEESRHRMVTRPLGTVLGCAAVYFLFPELPGTGSGLVFSVVMLSLMYCQKPGTWNHSFFGSCYALTLAAMTLGETAAVGLWVGYLAGAMVLVFLVNRFVFPTRRKTLFRYNLWELQRLLGRYCGVIKRTLYGRGMFFSSSEILACFHVVYQQSKAYIRDPDEDLDISVWQELLLTLWNMCAELEELSYLVYVGAVRREEYDSFQRQITAIQTHIQDGGEGVLPVEYREKDVTYVVEHYLESARLLRELKERAGIK